jgi:hypothetical protein
MRLTDGLLSVDNGRIVRYLLFFDNSWLLKIALNLYEEPKVRETMHLFSIEQRYNGGNLRYGSGLICHRTL